MVPSHFFFNLGSPPPPSNVRGASRVEAVFFSPNKKGFTLAALLDYWHTEIDLLRVSGFVVVGWLHATGWIC